jgi:hypothetical protein
VTDVAARVDINTATDELPPMPGWRDVFLGRDLPAQLQLPVPYGRGMVERRAWPGQGCGEGIRGRRLGALVRRDDVVGDASTFAQGDSLSLSPGADRAVLYTITAQGFHRRRRT